MFRNLILEGHKIEVVLLVCQNVLIKQSLEKRICQIQKLKETTTPYVLSEVEAKF